MNPSLGRVGRSAPWILGLIAVTAVGCPAATSPPDEELQSSSLPIADVMEVEPNDLNPDDLGVIQPPWIVGGSSDRCGSDGDWADSDMDEFLFSVGSPTALSVVLHAEGGDLDLYLLDAQGTLVAERQTPGLGGEELRFSLDQEVPYGLRIRCWLGEQARWALEFTEMAL
ncbi:MAG TPA: hypothetical protein DIU15_03405 [Deltaproteobacteria bacterium]|nr:hypothetical protein [Deltaproteobacteria bacterium]HCP45059.1 hypothetical protein [Deltaproteobacteria bacterium]